MKVVCNQNKMDKEYEVLVLFKPEGQKDIYDEDYYATESGYYYNVRDDEHVYDITIGKEYEVYGIMIFEGKIRYLVICDNTLTPNWITNDMFEIKDNRLPYNWCCNKFVSNNIEGTIIGYKELSNNYQHLLGLMSRKPDDMKIFLEEKDNTEYFSIINTET